MKNKNKTGSVLKFRDERLLTVKNGDISLEHDVSEPKGGGIIRRGNSLINFTATQMRIVRALLLNAGNAVTFNDLTEYVWDNVEESPEDPRHSLSIHLYHIKNALHHIGVIVENWHSVGYRLTISNA